MCHELVVARRRTKRDYDRDIALAWHIAAMTVAAKVGKLQPLQDVLKTRGPQTAQDHLAVLRVLSGQTGIPLQPSPSSTQTHA